MTTIEPMANETTSCRVLSSYVDWRHLPILNYSDGVASQLRLVVDLVDYLLTECTAIKGSRTELPCMWP